MNERFKVQPPMAALYSDSANISGVFIQVTTHDIVYSSDLFTRKFFVKP